MKIIKQPLLCYCLLAIGMLCCKTTKIQQVAPKKMVTYGDEESTFSEINKYIYHNGVYFANKGKFDEGTSIRQILVTDYRYHIMFESHNSSGRTYSSYHGSREGKFIDGKQEGYWRSERMYETGTKDSVGRKIKVWKIFREEYFKGGLRDSVYRVFNSKGETIYETYFNMGTGVEKDFHENGSLYYSVPLKDGYFADTLKIYNDAGKIIRKQVYNKDSLVLDQDLDERPFKPYPIGRGYR
jgi:hypothetical protein